MTSTIPPRGEQAAPATYDPLDPRVQQNPYPYYAKLRRDEPVKWLPRLQAFSVARYDELLRCFGTASSSARRSSGPLFWASSIRCPSRPR